jgi:predicted GIY-YIG superfamily endonuclease
MKGFSQKYDLTNLVYCKIINDIVSVIDREKQLKKYSRNKKTTIDYRL